MSKSYCNEVSQFHLEGQFLNFVIKDGYKLKGLILATPEGECYVKLAKHLRAAFDLRLAPGTWLQVVGEKKHDIETGEIKLKAERVMAARVEAQTFSTISASRLELVPASSTDAKKKTAKATILICQKSDCMKRGGKEVCQAMEAALSENGLEEQVTIKGTGCMKNCKAGPNLVMPDKTRYSRISAAQVPTLMNKHFASTNPVS
ncbi:(2Fe-2S) ferredoxin domain-containing protein [Iningainema tapete]|uniref:(2Fe-2S) ferredoxin domain-containing protein n=1 Tax=Iningainema tapete BLCC-T55 TaxID=2748662 RepID=A0A8J6XC87_9CYAN|nr:(2Fe-2S) ferredoxin domain-containing protein [Iningainema tapete]MBD2772820.1 (2Fe-2S) ferredoxin domain-containing protein [Iningainema tapete BLCC-T55]